MKYPFLQLFDKHKKMQVSGFTKTGNGVMVPSLKNIFQMAVLRRRYKIHKKEDYKRKKERRDNLDDDDDDEKEQLRKYEKKGKKVMRDNLDNEKKII